ncbi:MAG: dihydroxy-acid dehydratase, partial [Microbacteriaceae bacterium]|nr:dihydroxy-acid dehydratase [Burkholderiaceae bacterium]
DWDDFAQLSAAGPLLARVYPNGTADVNQFQAAGGPGYVIRELLDAGLVHEDVLTVREGGLREYTREPQLLLPLPGHDAGAGLEWTEIGETREPNIVRPVSTPFSPSGGLKLLTGNLGRSVIKISAVPPDRRLIEAPAWVFNGQDELLAAFASGELEAACRSSTQQGMVCVVRWQGPQANGMPELHKLTPPLAVLQGQGFRVALVTDGRMSGASGKVPAAIHVSPEAAAGGALARVRTSDLIRLDAEAGTLEALVPQAEWAAREHTAMPEPLRVSDAHGMGRELFSAFRRNALVAEQGACTWL